VESILGPLDTSATEWPTVSALGDRDDGEFGGIKIGRKNRSTGVGQNNMNTMQYSTVCCMLATLLPCK
jgi:hypothetical protein